MAVQGLDVVGVAVAGYAIAAGEDTAAVADGDGLAQVPGEQAGGAAEVEDLGVRAHHGGEDVGVTGEPSCPRWADPGVGAHQGGAADTADQVVVVDEDDDAGPVITVPGCRVVALARSVRAKLGRASATNGWSGGLA